MIDRLRSAVLTVQIIPFAYSALYIVSLIIYDKFGENTQEVIDSLFYVSPIVIASFLVLSRALHLCRWHKMACSIPLIPQIVSFVDYYIISFEEVYVHVFNGTIIAMLVLLLIAAYKVFLSPKHD